MQGCPILQLAPMPGYGRLVISHNSWVVWFIETKWKRRTIRKRENANEIEKKLSYFHNMDMDWL